MPTDCNKDGPVDAEAATAMEGSPSRGGKEDHNVVAGNVLILDGTRSWIVCGANFVILFVNAVFGRMLSMCFLEFVNEFNTSITTTSLSFTFHLLTLSFSSILGSSILIPVTGERVAAVVGGLLSGVSTMCMVLSSDIAVFIFLMAVKGVCVGISLVPAISMISQYFEKRRALATALANCGLSAGSMGAPPLINMLMEQYGLRGTFLIIGALELNAVAAAILLRPKSNYSAVLSSTDQGQSSTTVNQKANVEQFGVSDEREIQEKPMLETTKDREEWLMPVTTPSVSISYADVIYDNVSSLPGSFPTLAPSTAAQFVSSPEIRSQYAKRCPHIPRKRSISESQDRPRLQLLEDNISSSSDKVSVSFQPPLNGKIKWYNLDSSDQRLNHQFIPMISVNCEDNDSGLDVETDNTLKREETSPGPDKRCLHTTVSIVTPGASNVSRGVQLSSSSILWRRRNKNSSSSAGEFRMSSWSIVSSINAEISLDVEVCALENMKSETEAKEVPENTSGVQDVAVSTTLPQKVVRALQDAFNVSLLRLWTMRLLMLSSLTGTLCLYLPTYMPTIAFKQGLNGDQVSLLLTISGTVDLVSRIILGFFSDLHILKPSQIVYISQISLGTMCFFINFITTFDLFLVLAVVVGIFGCTRQNLITLVIIELVGGTRFLKALGSLAMTATLSLAVHHPLLNSILDATGSYAIPLYYVGFALYLSSLCLFLGPIFKRYDVKEETDQS